MIFVGGSNVVLCRLRFRAQHFGKPGTETVYATFHKEGLEFRV